ncbi:MAG: hypothetical protein HYW50_00375 [Candidatus Diapherotrites archaeon]|nr:hypothetical protein [Candidatus Diapherotrites archaeon]
MAKSTPETHFRKQLILVNLNYFMVINFSIFDTKSGWLNDGIYVHGLNKEIKEIITELGGPIKVSKLLNIKYTQLKEWPIGRKPISLEKLLELINLLDNENQVKVRQNINSADISLSARYSWRLVKFPKILSEDLAYVVGLVLGDGTLAGDKSNKKGNWVIGVFFDNKKHRDLYDVLIHKEFGVTSKHYQKNETCFTSYFCSKAVHWFLRSYFGVLMDINLIKSRFQT